MSGQTGRPFRTASPQFVAAWQAQQARQRHPSAQASGRCSNCGYNHALSNAISATFSPRALAEAAVRRTVDRAIADALPEAIANERRRRRAAR